ncbi:TPA: hypothetical protein ACGW7B_004432 [Bacillus nitratireducens]|nr:hypothetical protein bcere0001_41620 [Bacillus cereus m1293]HDR7515557.1 hypothetical protein [Bacillus mobilis]HDR7792216.1 hypothetical protein [Bacillus luti]HDR7547827.1 hypothetical protein [Bacillus mobilis]HDR7552254.1 hypothetical protein [Bacillus mobilis]
MKEHNLISFIKWARKKDIDLKQLNESYPSKVDDLVLGYLKDDFKNWDLKLLLKMFSYHIIQTERILSSEEDLLNCLKEFFNQKSYHKYVCSEIVDKRPVNVHEFLIDFIKFIKTNEKLQHDKLNNSIKALAKKSFEENKDFEWWISKTVESHSALILDLFSLYITTSFYSTAISDYIIWCQNQQRVYKIKEIFSSEEKTTFSFEDKVKVLKKKITDKKDFTTLKAIIYPPTEKISEDNSLLFLDFLHFLDKEKIKINKPLSVELLEEKVKKYCEINSLGRKENKRTLKAFKLLCYRDKHKFTKKKKEFEEESGIELSIDRLFTPKAHCFLLLRPADRIQEFIQLHGTAIHDITDDTLDVYFSARDLEGNTRPYKEIKKFMYMNNILKSDIPSLIIWDKFGRSIESISFREIWQPNFVGFHESIFRTIVFLVEALENHDDFITALNSTKLKMQDLQETTGNTFINIGNQVGAQGPNPVVHNPTFTN